MGISTWKIERRPWWWNRIRKWMSQVDWRLYSCIQLSCGCIILLTGWCAHILIVLHSKTGVSGALPLPISEPKWNEKRLTEAIRIHKVQWGSMRCCHVQMRMVQNLLCHTFQRDESPVARYFQPFDPWFWCSSRAGFQPCPLRGGTTPLRSVYARFLPGRAIEPLSEWSHGLI